MAKRKTGVLISGNGSNLQALIDACESPGFPAEIAVVISNKDSAYGLNRARNAGIAAHIISHKDYKTREEFDKQINEMLRRHSVEFVCLAGFMRLLSPWFVKKWQNKMLNIHPSLLPNFKGAHAIADALAAGAKTTGCTVHLVSEQVDSGKIIVQSEVKILPGDNEETLAERIHEQEHKIYPQALKMLIEGKI